MAKELAVVTRIYAMVNPLTREARYVGKTVKTLEARRSEHIRRAKSGDKCYRNRWIRSEISQGREPEMIELERTEGEDWASAESFWIEYLRSLGARLTNTTSGGEGCHGRVLSSETRAKIGIRHLGKTISAEHRAILSRVHSGVAKSDIFKRNASERAKGRAEKVMAGVVAAVAAGMSPRQLRDAGYSFRAIGRAIGVCHHTAKLRAESS